MCAVVCRVSHATNAINAGARRSVPPGDCQFRRPCGLNEHSRREMRRGVAAARPKFAAFSHTVKIARRCSRCAKPLRPTRWKIITATITNAGRPVVSPQSLRFRSEVRHPQTAVARPQSHVCVAQRDQSGKPKANIISQLL